ncbi:MAG: bifunctional glutamine synthetase adenylyltransferase/deadenyltransferase, partial [Woeseia sp.]
NAWTWEHQALLRARPVAGHAGVAREFERIRADTLIGRVNRDSLRDDVRAMREKMRAQLDGTAEGGFDLKQGKGGIGDIEFLVQYLVLANAAREPAIIHYPDNIRQLGTLGAAGCLPRETVSRLQDSYRAYRLRLHTLLLDGKPPVVAGDAFPTERAFVSALWDELLA